MFLLLQQLHAEEITDDIVVQIIKAMKDQLEVSEFDFVTFVQDLKDPIQQRKYFEMRKDLFIKQQ